MHRQWKSDKQWCDRCNDWVETKDYFGLSEYFFFSLTILFSLLALVTLTPGATAPDGSKPRQACAICGGKTLTEWRKNNRLKEKIYILIVVTFAIIANGFIVVALMR